ncbi:MAG TPA: phosphoglycerate kinase [Planctomycetota bacterium]
MAVRKRTLRQVDFAGKRAFVRVDFNVPLRDGAITDDTRIRAAVPTLQAILAAGGSVVAASHLGRPKGKAVDALRLKPVAERLRALLPGVEVRYVTDVAGPEAAAAAAELRAGEVLLLENLRFEPGETENDKDLAARLAALADVFVEDAFGACHRAHASTAALPGLLKPAVAGLLLEREIEAFHRIMDVPRRPVVAVIGGAKVSDKLPVLQSLLQRAQVLLIGGGMAYTFLAAKGIEVGGSLLEEDRIDAARAVLAAALRARVRLLLPTDHVIADAFADDAAFRVVEGAIPKGWMGLDIGPATQHAYRLILAGAGTVVWNGPMGVFEMSAFREGTLTVARAVADSDAVSVVGGGDSVAAIAMAGVTERIGFVSTGGGAFLEMLEGKQLPGIAALDDAPAA